MKPLYGLGKTDLEDSSADAIVKLVLASQSGLATKTDIDLLRKDFKGELASQRADFKGELASQRADFKEELANLRADFKEEFANQRADFETLRADFETLRGDFKHLDAKVDALASKVDSTLDGLKYRMIVWVLVGAAVTSGFFKTIELIFF